MNDQLQQQKSNYTVSMIL